MLNLHTLNLILLVLKVFIQDDKAQAAEIRRLSLALREGEHLKSFKLSI